MITIKIVVCLHFKDLIFASFHVLICLLNLSLDFIVCRQAEFSYCVFLISVSL